MNDNPYSKYRYSNNGQVKVRADDLTNKIVDVFGVNLRPISDNITTNLYDMPCDLYGTTTVTNYIYKVQRINQVDSSIVSPLYKGPTFFRLFKL